MLYIFKLFFLFVSVVISFQIYCHVISRRNKIERHDMCINLTVTYGLAGVLLFAFKDIILAILAIWLMFLAFRAVEIGKNPNVSFKPVIKPTAETEN